MNNILKWIAGVGLILYPFFVAYALAHGQYVWVSAVLIALGILRLLSKGNTLLWPLTGFAILCGGVLTSGTAQFFNLDEYGIA